MSSGPPPEENPDPDRRAAARDARVDERAVDLTDADLVEAPRGIAELPCARRCPTGQPSARGFEARA